MNKNDLRIIKTKQSLHQALIKLLNKKPLEQIKITELCKEANINRGTFYLHYTDVGDVFADFFSEIMKDLKESYEEPYKFLSTLMIKTLDPATIRIFHHIKKYEDYYEIVFSKKVSLTYYYMLFDQIRLNIKNDVHTIKSTEIINDFYLSYVANAIIGLIIEWHNRGFTESVEEMNIQLVEILKIQVTD